MNVLRERVALVTGSSRGIGAAIARLFAGEGAAVAVHGRDRSAVTAVCARNAADGGRAMQAVANVTQYDQIEAMRRDVGSGD